MWCGRDIDIPFQLQFLKTISYSAKLVNPIVGESNGSLIRWPLYPLGRELYTAEVIIAAKSPSLLADQH